MANPTMVMEPLSYDLVNRKVTRRKVCFGMRAEYYDILSDGRLLHSTEVKQSVSTWLEVACLQGKNKPKEPRVWPVTLLQSGLAGTTVPNQFCLCLGYALETPEMVT
jgi:hypothetical protein